MITSGIVITLSADPALAWQAQATLHARPELTLGKLNARWLPVALEAADVGASRDFHDWLNTVPGVDFVDVVEVNFVEEEGLRSQEVSLNTRPHPGPLPQERGKRSLSHSKTRDGIVRMSRRDSADSHSLFPLPGGESHGEGERQTILQPQPKAAIQPRGDL